VDTFRVEFDEILYVYDQRIKRFSSRYSLELDRLFIELLELILINYNE
jgi:hypothetical protein